MYWLHLKLLNLVCECIMNIPTNHIWSMVYNWAITKYLRGADLKLGMTRNLTWTKSTDAEIISSSKKYNTPIMLITFCNICTSVNNNKLDHSGLQSMTI